MLRGLAGLIVSISGAGCFRGRNDQPVPNNPVTYSRIPKTVVEMEREWKIGRYVTGIRIETDDSYFVTDLRGLFTQKQVNEFYGRGMDEGPNVDPAVIRTFKEISDLCKDIAGREEVTFYGDLMKRRGGDNYLVDGKKVIFLYAAQYGDAVMEVNRRIFDN